MQKNKNTAQPAAGAAERARDENESCEGVELSSHLGNWARLYTRKYVVFFLILASPLEVTSSPWYAGPLLRQKQMPSAMCFGS